MDVEKESNSWLELGSAIVISERQFARGYHSFWRGLLPLSESYVRRLNATKHLFVLPALINSLPTWNAVVSEASFLCFVHNLLHSTRPIESGHDNRLVAEAWREASAYVSKLDETVSREEPLDEQNVMAVINLTAAITQFFKTVERGEKLVVRPKFIGCGLLDTCEGDVLAGRVLYEIKNVEREFRAVDIRQLLIYSFLDYIAGARRVLGIGLVNARRGTFFRASLSRVCRGMAATSPADLFRQMELFLEADAPFGY